jgi:hypothetical protein
MSTNHGGVAFGIIESAERFGDDLLIVGHRYVAVAFDRDDPYLEARFIGIEAGGLSDQVLREIDLASDLYECSIRRSDEGVAVEFSLPGDMDVEFRCRELVFSTRYYTKNEVEGIMAWLPSRCSDEELHAYLRALRRHGFAVTLDAEGVSISDEA